jgi:hypothetical protein
LGVATFTYFMSGLYFGWSYEPTGVSEVAPNSVEVGA